MIQSLVYWEVKNKYLKATSPELQFKSKKILSSEMDQTLDGVKCQRGRGASEA